MPDKSTMRQLTYTSHILVGCILLLMNVGCTSFGDYTATANTPRHGGSGTLEHQRQGHTDSAFIKKVLSEFDGNRELASQTWSAAADKLLSAGKLPEAEHDFRQALLLSETNFSAYWGLGRLLLERDDMDAAIGYLEKARVMSIDSGTPTELLVDLGTAYLIQANEQPASESSQRSWLYSVASRQFEAATRNNPKSANVWMRWSFALYREGRYRDAMVKLANAQALGAPVLDSYQRKLTSLANQSI